MKSNIHKLERILSIAAGGALAAYGFTPKTTFKRFTLPSLLTSLTGSGLATYGLTSRRNRVPSLLTSLAGTGLATYGLFFHRKRKISPRNILLGVLGTSLIVRGITGTSLIYKAVGYSTRRGVDSYDTRYEHTPQDRKGKKIDRSIVVNAPVDKVYRFFSNFENIPQFMNHVESVKYTGADRTHWVVKNKTGKNLEYDARIKTNIPNEVISWESVSGNLPNAGTVRFHPVAGDTNATRLEVTMEFNPPGGVLADIVADLLQDPERQLDEGVHNFKRIVESTTKATGKTA